MHYSRLVHGVGHTQGMGWMMFLPLYPVFSFGFLVHRFIVVYQHSESAFMVGGCPELLIEEVERQW
jgi:hypothetical protein